MPGRSVKVHTDSEVEDTAIGMKLDTFGFFKAYKPENRERHEISKSEPKIYENDLKMNQHSH